MDGPWWRRASSGQLNGTAVSFGLGRRVAGVTTFGPGGARATRADTYFHTYSRDHIGIGASASPPVPAPREFKDYRRVSVQPSDSSIDSCLPWFTVDLFLDEQGSVALVTLDVWEP